MKKALCILAALLIILLLFSGCRADPAQERTTETAAPPPEHIVEGVIQAATADTVSILTDGGETYLFSIEHAVTDQSLFPYEPEARARLTYTGTLDTSRLEQTAAFVSLLLILAAPPAVTEDMTEAATAAPPPPDPAQALLATMTLEEKVGQMFMARCPPGNAAPLATQYAPGGYLLFARDFQGQTKESAAANIQSYQAASKIKMLIGVDEEGGSVNRVSQFPAFRQTPFAAPQTVYQLGGFEGVRSDAIEKAALLKSIGVNVNFAPVCDLSVNPADFIYKRTFGMGAPETSQYVQTVVGAYQENGLGSVLKHFPGYGGNADTHTQAVHDSRPLEQLRSADFLPFKAGIDAGAPCVLVAHNIVQAVDGVNPASLSPAVYALLREELGFSGVTITDDLAMGAVKQYTSDASAAVMAVQAGSDMLICTNFAEQIPGVITAVQTGQIPESRIDTSVLRILRWKLQLGLI